MLILPRRLIQLITRAKNPTRLPALVAQRRFRPIRRHTLVRLRLKLGVHRAVKAQIARRPLLVVLVHIPLVKLILARVIRFISMLAARAKRITGHRPRPLTVAGTAVVQVVHIQTAITPMPLVVAVAQRISHWLAVT